MMLPISKSWKNARDCNKARFERLDDSRSDMATLKVKITRLPHGKDLPLPAYATSGSAGMDLYAALSRPDDARYQHWTHTLQMRGGMWTFSTGIAIALPDGYEAQVRPRSGLASKHGITVLNAPATIDSDYRGEIKVVLINHSHASFKIEKGMRIAQLVVAPVTRVAWEPVDTLDETERNASGFGSTGA